MLPAKILYRLFILFVLLQTNLPAFAQNNSLPLDEWVKSLDADDDTLNKNLMSYYMFLKAWIHPLFFLL
jgi:hypothetical protein